MYEATRERPPERRSIQLSGSCADIDGDESHRPLDVVEQHVVRAHHLAAVDVHDLLVEEIGLQEDLVLALVEPCDVDALRPEPCPRRIEALDRAPWEVDASATGAHHKARDRRMACADRNDQIVDRTDGVDAAVTNGSSNESREMEHRALRCLVPPKLAGSPAVYAGQPSARYPSGERRLT